MCRFLVIFLFTSLNLQAQVLPSQILHFKSLNHFLKVVQERNLQLKAQAQEINISQETKNLIYLEQTVPIYKSTLNKRVLSINSKSETTVLNNEFKWTPFFITNTELNLGIESVQNFEFSDLSNSSNNLSSLSNTSSLNRWTSRYFVGIKQPLLRDGLIGNKKIILQQYDKKIKLSKIQYKELLEQILQNAILAFLHYSHQKKLVSSLIERVQNNQEIERFQKNKLKTGTVEQTDIYQANITLLNSLNSLEQQQFKLKSIETDILNLLNIKDQNIDFNFIHQQLTLKEKPILKNLYAKALISNQSLRVTNALLEITQSELKFVKKSLYPKLDFEAKLFKGSREDNLLTSYQNSINGRFEYFIGGTFELPLTGYFNSTKKFKHQVQKANIEKLRQTSLLYFNIKKLISRFKLNQKQLNTHQKIYALSQKRHQLLHQKYLQGQINYVDYINSQNNLQESLNSSIQASLEYQINTLELQKISGQLIIHYQAQL